MTDDNLSDVMRAAAKAAVKVSGWSASKQEFASRAVAGRRTPRYGWAIPNRLYGVQINEDGDAV